MRAGKSTSHQVPFYLPSVCIVFLGRSREGKPLVMRPITYREPDFAFGQLMLSLRIVTGQTQVGLAELLKVSRRTIGEWEGGQSYPKPEHLKNFIAFCLKQHGFNAGHEAEEIQALWQAARQKVLLDEFWLHELLNSAHPEFEAPVYSKTDGSGSYALPSIVPIVVTLTSSYP